MDLSVSTKGTTDRVRGALVSGNYFSVLGVRPVVGTAIEPADPVSAGLALAVLAAATLTAAWVPARRAAGIDPIRALRYE